MVIASAVLLAASSETPAMKTLWSGFGLGASGFSCAIEETDKRAARMTVQIALQIKAENGGERRRKGGTR